MKEYLKGVPPFDLLSEEELDTIVQDMSMEYYPRGYKILVQNGPPAEHLRIIKKGAVKIYLQNQQSEEIIIDFRGEKELFGFISLVSADKSRATVQAVEDTICYLIPRERVLALIERHPTLNEYFYRSFFLNFIDKTREETKKRYSMIGQTEQYLFTTTVGELVRRKPVTVSSTTPIYEASKIMSKERIGSIIITEDNIPIGIVTDRDLRERVIAKKRDIGEPVRNIMSTPLIRVDASEPSFDALLKMIRYNIHHVVVVENGVLKGVVSHHDLMLLQGYSPMVLVKDIEDQPRIEDLRHVHDRLLNGISLFLREGLKAQNITGLITEFYEKIINKIVDLIEKRLGPSPLPYTLFFYGEGARRELSLAPRLCLAVVLQDTNNLNLIESTRSYFKEFSILLREALEIAGIKDRASKTVVLLEQVLCRQDWIELLEKRTSDPFYYTPEPEEFDIRSIRGDDTLIQELINYIYAKRNDEEFMDYLATVTVENRPPLGFFKRFVVEKTGEHRNELDLYEKGIKPIVDSIRVFSIEKGVKRVCTFNRITELKRRSGLQLLSDIEQAMDYLLTLLLHEQMEKIEEGGIADTFINPEKLSTLERKTLKEAFQLIAEVYDTLEKSYRTERV